MRIEKRKFVLSVGLLAIMLLPVHAGCYSRVVRADGASGARYDVYEPNLKTEADKPPARSSSAKKSEGESKKFLGIF